MRNLSFFVFAQPDVTAMQVLKKSSILLSAPRKLTHFGERATKVAFIMLVTFALLGSSLAPAPQPTDALEAGLKVYHAAYCGTCHTLAAAGTRGRFGPSHDHLAAVIQARFADGSYTGQAQNVAEYLRESLLDPQAFLDPAYAGSRYQMPAFTNLSPGDKDALIVLLEQP